MSIAAEARGVKPTDTEPQAPEPTAAPSSRHEARKGRKGRAGSIDKTPLVGKDRQDFEAAVLRRTGRGGPDHLARVLLFDFHWGKADSFPDNDTLAEATKRHKSTVQRWLQELQSRGVVEIVEDPTIRARRRIVFLDHPNAKTVLASIPPVAKIRPKPVKGSKTRPSRASKRVAGCDGEGSSVRPTRVAGCDPNLRKGISEEETPLKTTTTPKSGASSRADAPACEGDPGADAASRLASGDGGRFVADDSDGGGDDWDIQLVEWFRRLVAEVKRLGERLDFSALNIYGCGTADRPVDVPELVAAEIVDELKRLDEELGDDDDDGPEGGNGPEGGYPPEILEKAARSRELMSLMDQESRRRDERRARVLESHRREHPDDDPPPTNPGDDTPTVAAKAPESPQDAPKAVEASIPSSEADKPTLGDSRPSGEKEGAAPATDQNQAVEADPVEKIDPPAKAQPDPEAKAKAEADRRREEREEAERREREDLDTDNLCLAKLANPDTPPDVRESALGWLKRRDRLDLVNEALGQTPPAEATPEDVRSTMRNMMDGSGAPREEKRQSIPEDQDRMLAGSYFDDDDDIDF